MSEPCEGHPCDRCPTCSKERCCRRDNPNYRLPELGEWDGPIFGELGALADDGDKAECHCCGRFFRHLGNHTTRTHDLTPDEYRAIFGLRQGTGLIGPGLVPARQRNAAMLQQQHPDAIAKALASLTPEQRSANASYKLRLQSRRDPKWQAAIKHALGAAHTASARLRAAGLLTSDASHMNTPEVQSKARESFAAKMSDPVVRETWVEKIRQKQLAAQRRKGRDFVPKTREVTCDVCGRTVVRRVSTSQMARTMHLCGARECLLENRRRIAKNANVTQRSDVREKISAIARQRAIIRDNRGRIVGFQRGA